MIRVNNELLSEYKFIDLFCGIGGFHIAMSSFGAKCVFACDIDPEVKKVYKENFNMNPQGDITAIEANQIPSHDIICAGFPCQPFSISGDQAGFNDAKGRGKLFFEIVKIAQLHQPQLILLENVRNFEKHDEGRTLQRVHSELNNAGYTVFSRVLCASSYGVPQARKRIYIVAFRKNLDVKSFNFPDALAETKVLGDILIEDGENSVVGNYYIARQYEINKTHNIRSGSVERIGQIGQGRQGERIYSVFGQAVTLSSQGGGLGGRTGMYLMDNNSVRKLYPRECARLMGFPDNFILADTQGKNYKQFGNSVVVDVLQYIIQEAAKYLKK